MSAFYFSCHVHVIVESTVRCVEVSRQNIYVSAFYTVYVHWCTVMPRVPAAPCNSSVTGNGFLGICGQAHVSSRSYPSGKESNVYTCHKQRYSCESDRDVDIVCISLTIVKKVQVACKVYIFSVLHQFISYFHKINF